MRVHTHTRAMEGCQDMIGAGGGFTHTHTHTMVVVSHTYTAVWWWSEGVCARRFSCAPEAEPRARCSRLFCSPQKQNDRKTTASRAASPESRQRAARSLSVQDVWRPARGAIGVSPPPPSFFSFYSFVVYFLHVKYFNII